MKKLILLALIALAACTNENHAMRALRGSGYTEVQFTGFRIIGCGEDDDFATGFRAKGPSGQTVSGVVCSGLFKGATIRTD